MVANKFSLIDTGGDTTPVTAGEFSCYMAALPPLPMPPRVAVAVSGGADSMALTLLLAEWVNNRNGTLHAFTVDHGLRQEAGQEAAQVGKWLAAHGITHQILRWDGNKPVTRIQETARTIRYHLLADACRSQHILHLFLAHHQDDQAETFLMRLGRNSGPVGLAGIAAASEREGIHLLRPLLRLPKSRLIATLSAKNQPWINDPSNASNDYTRNRIRALLPSLEAVGISAATITDTTDSMAHYRLKTEQAVAQVLVRHATFHPQAYVTLTPHWHTDIDASIALPMLHALVRTVSGNITPPRGEALQQLYAQLKNASFTRTSFHGCLFTASCRKQDSGSITITREPARIAGASLVAAHSSLIWDGRFKITNHTARPLHINTLNTALYKTLLPAGAKPLPAAIISTLPIARDLDGQHIAPHIGVGSTCEAMIYWSPPVACAPLPFYAARATMENAIV